MRLSQRSQRLPSKIVMLSLLGALVLTIVPLPREWMWLRPEWVVLFMVYWVMMIPEKINVGSGWVLGLAVDILEGSLLGQHALGLMVVAYVSLIFYQRMRMYSVLQQVFVVFLLVTLYGVLCQWVQSLWHGDALTFKLLLPALTTALLWPFLVTLFPRLYERSLVS